MRAIYGFCARSTDVPGEIARFFQLPSPLHASPDAPMGAFAKGRIAVAAGREGTVGQTPDGRFACVVDGEILNAEHMSRRLEELGCPASSREAPDIILACRLTGKQEVFREIRGSYVFAIADTVEERVTLGRDMYGTKILYYADTPGGLAFSSRLADLARCPWVSKEISPDGLLRYLAGGYVITPHTLYRDIFALEPGHLMTFGEGERQDQCFFQFEPESWEFMNTDGMTEEALVDRFEELLADSLKHRVPSTGKTAVYLSGGHDTTMLCGAIRKHTDREITAFTLGLKGSHNDESHYADQVAEHLRLEHHLYYLKKDDFFEALDLIPEIYGQPYADISAIPTFVIARQVAERYDQVICGDGPDFMFGNFDFAMLYHYYRRVPAVFHKAVSRLADVVIRTFFKPWISPNLSVPELLKQPALFWVFQKKFKGPALEKLLMKTVDAEQFRAHRFIMNRTDIPVSERLLLTEHMFYGLDDVFCKATAIHNALGVRLMRPLYDQPLFEFCRFLPTKWKFRRGRGRYLQNQLIYRYVPREMMNRPKRGFIVDFVEFGRDEIKGLADKYLSRKRLGETGLFDADYAAELVSAYFSGQKTLGPKMWVLLMFEMWREKFGM